MEKIDFSDKYKWTIGDWDHNPKTFKKLLVVVEMEYNSGNMHE